MRKVLFGVVALFLGVSLVMAAPKKKETLKGAPTAKEIDKATNKVSWRTDSKVSASIAGGKGHITFVPADLKHMETANMANGALIGKIDTDHASDEIPAPGQYVVYVEKRGGAWKAFYCQKGEAVSEAKRVKASSHDTHDPEFVSDGHVIRYWILDISW